MIKIMSGELAEILSMSNRCERCKGTKLVMGILGLHEKCKECLGTGIDHSKDKPKEKARTIKEPTVVFHQTYEQLMKNSEKIEKNHPVSDVFGSDPFRECREENRLKFPAIPHEEFIAPVLNESITLADISKQNCIEANNEITDIPKKKAGRPKKNG